MTAITLSSLRASKERGEKIVMLTCYDATFAAASEQAGVEILLVGDSLGMVLQGQDSTLPVSLEDMAYHVASVKRGSRSALILADLPFMTYASQEAAYGSATRLMQAGAQMVKLEGGQWLAPIIAGLTERGIPVCAHLGLTPQAVNVLGGYKVQGRGEAAARRLLETAHSLSEAGAALLVLECVPSTLAARVSRTVQVPVIGIGAGADVDGQVLVLHDMLGLSLSGRSPKFVRNFMQGAGSIGEALAAYTQAVKSGEFPAAEHGFSA